MDELTMNGMTAEDIFSPHHKGRNTPSPIIMENGTEPSVKPMDLKYSSSDTASSSQSPSPTLELFRATWHPHQYSVPSIMPTPFTIKDILGLGEDESFKEEKVEDELLQSSPVSPSPTTPSPQPLSMELDEPLNLTMGRRGSDSPSSSTSLTDETNNNNRPVNGRLFTVNHSVSRDKSPTLLPNDVIIPKVKHPKIPASPATKNGTTKNKGCGAINLKTGTKRKAKVAGGPTPKVLAIETRLDTATPLPNNGVLSPGLENGSSNDSKKRKKARTTFTGKQIYELERQFEIKKYLSSSERSEMARLLNVTEVQVKIWFQNRRTKWKKQDNISNAEAAEHKVLSTKSSKKEKNGSSNQSKGGSSKRKSNSGGRLPGTSECSLSVSGSMDSSDDHSNGSHLTDGTTSEGGLSEYNKAPKDFSLVQKLQGNNHKITTTVPCQNSVLLSQLSNQPSTPGPLLSPPNLHSSDDTENRGRSPPITIPRLPFSSTSMNLFSSLGIKAAPVKAAPVKAETTLSPALEESELNTLSKLSASSIEENLETENKPSNDLPNNLVLSMCSSLGEDGGNEEENSDGDEQLLSVNKSSDNLENFIPVSQAS